MKYFITLFLVLSPAISFGDIVRIGPNNFIAGVRSREFEFFAAPEINGHQRQSNWCWAACVQMVLNYHGLLVDQEDVVQRIFGEQVNLPAQPAQILAALSGWAADSRGRYSQIYASPYILRSSDIVRDLGSKWPLIVGLSNPGGGGHALVLTAVYYTVGPDDEPLFYKVILRDPWPDNPSRQELSWDDFIQRMTFIARVSVRRK